MALSKKEVAREANEITCDRFSMDRGFDLIDRTRMALVREACSVRAVHTLEFEEPVVQRAREVRCRLGRLSACDIGRVEDDDATASAGKVIGHCESSHACAHDANIARRVALERGPQRRRLFFPEGRGRFDGAHTSPPSKIDSLAKGSSDAPQLHGFAASAALWTLAKSTAALERWKFAIDMLNRQSRGDGDRRLTSARESRNLR